MKDYKKWLFESIQESFQPGQFLFFHLILDITFKIDNILILPEGDEVQI